MKRKPTESKLGSGDGSMSLSQEAESKATPPTIANKLNSWSMAFSNARLK